MLRFKRMFFTLFMVFVLAGGQAAGAEDNISIYTTGKVIAYDAGNTIDLLDGVGDSHTYFISPDTDMPEKIEEGMIVEVSASNVLAIRIEVLSE